MAASAAPVPTQLSATPSALIFDSTRALQHIEQQVSFGPRIAGSQAHAQAVQFMQSHLQQSGWQVEIQSGQRQNTPIKNVIAKWGQGKPWVILGAHYDTRRVSDKDPDPAKQSQAGPGANDGASGVAVLLELARLIPHIPELQGTGQIWLVFFDAEDNGNLPGSDWIQGSRYFVESLTTYPDAALVIDMIGDSDQNIYRESNSDSQLTDQLWNLAASLGYGDRIINQPGFSIIDDHIPFIEAGIPAVDIIDINYPYWHTTQDSVDKISAQSLQVVGDTLLAWLKYRGK